MLYEKKAKRKRIFRKCMVIFFTVVVMVSMCSITAFAEDSLLDEVSDGETPWSWPLDGLFVCSESRWKVDLCRGWGAAAKEPPLQQKQ